jgi:hypothetical protein
MVFTVVKVQLAKVVTNTAMTRYCWLFCALLSRLSEEVNEDWHH